MIAQLLSVLFALLAAGFGFAAFFVPMPKAIKHVDYGFIDPQTPKPVDDLDRLMGGLNRQGRLAALAAVSGLISALLQFWIIFSPST